MQRKGAAATKKESAAFAISIRARANNHEHGFCGCNCRIPLHPVATATEVPAVHNFESI